MTIRIATMAAVWVLAMALTASNPAANAQNTQPVASAKSRPEAGVTSNILDLGGGVKMELVWIPGGTFQMGSSDADEAACKRYSMAVDLSDEKPVHAVTVDGFWMGKYEVTNAQYRRFDPSHLCEDFDGMKLDGDQQPVVYVSWDDAKKFCAWLSQRARGTFRLPTEAEWEYACRAGTTTVTPWGDLDSSIVRYANLGEGSSGAPWSTGAARDWSDGFKVTAPVGSFKPNAFGLYDMIGNVEEWCEDWYGKDYYAQSANARNPTGPPSGQGRILRGGSWRLGPEYCRAAERSWKSPDLSLFTRGFRVACPQAKEGIPAGKEDDSKKMSSATSASQTQSDIAAPQTYVESAAGLDMKMVWIKGGTFWMGSNDNSSNEKPAHEVALDGYWLGETEVTQAQYEPIMGQNPSKFIEANYPVDYVSWNDAMEFCRRLSQKTGKKYSLPAEAQWEYACRAGSRGKYCFGDSISELGDYAWYRENSNEQTHPVRQKKPNAWGLYDMHGNVLEWCADWYGEYSSGRTANPVGANQGSSRVYRGGSWDNGADFCRSAIRFKDVPMLANLGLGFRVCRVDSPR
ncbi:MAG: formylglycine-generating enzyme family protein [Candidatus Sumerlaeota bacterium]|nr:formylglycine-generating enzyme family protein [Candidatus Sumerlaeota bacterium]